MSKRILIFYSLFILVSGAIASDGIKDQRPNFVFILTDDHRYDYLGCTGNELIQTPQIDKLAEEGILFTNAHITSAICTPSRISILLSQFERKHGVNFNSGTSVSEEAWQQSYPVVMRKNGYYTGYVGKNHSPIGDGGYNSGVMEKSFDYWYAGHGHLSFYPKQRHEIFKAAKNDTQVEVVGEGVIDFLSNEQSLEGAQHFLANRPEDQPFCLSVCLNLPHGSSTSTMQLLESDSSIYKTLYRDQDIPLPNNYIAKVNISSPKLPAEIHFSGERQTGYNYVDNEEELKERIIRSMQTVTGIDGLIGNIRKTLKEHGLDKNTIIIFSSDHGLFFGEFGLGGKALCYEITTKVPLIIYNPLLKKKQQGLVSNELVQSIDIAPTMLDYAGIEIPEVFQGKSMKSLTEGDDEKLHEYLFTENLWSTQFGNPRCESVQDKEWKYIRYYKNENLKASAKIEVAKLLGITQKDMLYAQHDPDIALYRTFIEGPINGEAAVYEELFNLKGDPDEKTNLANVAQYKSILARMRDAWGIKIKEARGEGPPKVIRYTKDSMLEKGGPIVHE